MTANQFFVRAGGRRGQIVTLEDGEHRHLARAARVRAGEEVRLFDAEGRRYRARVESIGDHQSELRILAVEDARDAAFQPVLAQALVPSRIMDDIIQKAIELGAARVIPLVTARSLRPEAAAGKTERWLRVARAAVKQSKGERLPRIDPPAELMEFLAAAAAGPRFILSEHGGAPLGPLLAASPRPAEGTATVVVGPAGGWTEEEVAAFRAAGFIAVSLGPRVLRTETAAVTAVALVSHFWGG